MTRSSLRPSPSLSASPEFLQALESNRLLRAVLEEQNSDRELVDAERRAWTEERRLLRAMIDQVPDYLFAKDTQCRFVVANIAVAADLGLGPEEILGKSDLDLHPPELARNFMANEQSVMLTGEPMLDHEEYVLRTNGEKRWLSTSKVPLRNSEGAIIGLVGISRDVTLRKHSEEEMRRLAYRDQLTGLANRAHFELELKSAIELKSKAFLLAVDLDGFKQVNDTHGHAAGDELLRQVGERLLGVSPEGGFVSRMGGDEFAMVFPIRHPVAEMCEAISRTLSDRFQLSDTDATIGASIGAALINEAPTASEALRRADFALYAAKAAGRGQWRLYEAEMGNSRARRLQLQHELPGAIEAGEVFAVYQPIYRVDGRSPIGAEALTRWRHPNLGILPPAQFISIAEETGVIQSIGDHMLRQACTLLAGSNVPWVAVNVSTVQLHSEGFAKSTLATIDAAGIDPSRIQLEITESVLLQDTGIARTMLETLSAAGVCLALDDFGTGFSSLSYLSRFPVNKIKIDRSFVSDIGTKRADAIVRAVVALAGGLDMTVTAEGVETEAQRAFLEHVGCDEIQGYLASRPIADFELLRTFADVGGHRV